MQAYCVKCGAKKGNEGYKGHNHEEWKAGDPRRMPELRNKNVQNR